jgi:nucleoside-diphosphate-sugar epimerase
LLGGEDHSYISFLHLLARVANLRPRWLPTMPWLVVALTAYLAEARAWFTGREPLPTIGQVRMNRWYFHASSDRARTELGYAARPVEETLRDTYAWYRSQGHRGPRGVLRWWLRAA